MKNGEVILLNLNYLKESFEILQVEKMKISFYERKTSIRLETEQDFGLIMPIASGEEHIIKIYEQINI